MNIKKYYFYKFFEELMPIYPLYLLLFESKHLSVSQISLLLIIWSLPVVLLEIPSGIIADQWSRKNLLVLGSMFKVLCFLIWLYSNSFLPFAIGFIFWGISSAFCSGSEEALIFDSLKANDNEQNFENVLSRGRFLSGLSFTLSSIAGGFIATHWGISITLMFSIIAGLICVSLSLTFKEVNFYKDSKLHINSKSHETLVKAFRFFFHHKQLLLFALLSTFVIGTAGILDEYDQLIAKEYGLPIVLIGIWTSCRSLLVALGSILAPFIKKVIVKVLHVRTPIYIVSIICLIASILLGLSGLIHHILIMFFYGLYFLLMSSGSILQEDYFQQQIEDEGRSTVHSIVSLVYNLYCMLFYALLILIFTQMDLFGSLILISVYMFILTLLICLFYLKINKT